ncbi:MAG: hypothetical protein CSA81_01690 [Acidobacteria bacterium]|nr:MAG: hypothetical protein CSA81_01690 [Acidobacteriota bacterium]
MLFLFQTLYETQGGFMQSSSCHLTTEYLFGEDHSSWFTFSESDKEELGFPSHLCDQVLKVAVCPKEKEQLHLFEFMVAEQFPKDSFSHLARVVKKLCGEKAFIHILHSGSLSTHLVISGPGKQYHLDLDFNRLSEFDRQCLSMIRQADNNRYTKTIHLLEREGISQNLFKKLKGFLQRTQRKNLRQHRAAVDLLLKMVFLVFVQKKGWLNLDPFYMERKMEQCHQRGLSILHCFLKPLFARLNGRRIAEPLSLGTLPHLGGGLFNFNVEHLPLMKNHLFLDLHREVLSAYSFTLLEEKERVSPLGVTPEVLGTVFENLMKPDERKNRGVFFTPSKVARRQVMASFESYMKGREVSLNALEKIRVLDPSCGSGTYLVCAFQCLLKYRLDLCPDSERYNGNLFKLKTDIVLNNLYGMDINPLAVRLTEVRLWLNMIQDLEVGSPDQAPQLPNLQHHLRVGDFLSVPDSWEAARIRKWSKYPYLRKLKRKFVQSSNRQAVLTHLFRLERELAQFLSCDDHRDNLEAYAERKRQKVLPGFESQAVTDDRSPRIKEPMHDDPLGPHIAFCSEILTGGFDLVLGNPPWQSSKDMAASGKEKIKHLIQKTTGCNVSGQMDLSLLFCLLSFNLLSRKGHLSFLLPGKFLQARYGKSFRSYIRQKFHLSFVFDYGIDHNYIFKADTFPLALGISSRSDSQTPSFVHVERIGKNVFEQYRVKESFFSEAGHPWMIPSAEDLNLIRKTHSYDKLENEAFSIKRGVVTGCKRLFTFHKKPRNMSVKPLLRGRDLQDDSVKPGAWIFWPFDRYGKVACNLNRSTARHFGVANQRELSEKVKYRAMNSAKYRLIWRYLDSRLRAWLLYDSDWVPDQTTYYIDFSCRENALRYFYLLNSDMADKWTRVLAERGKDRYRFFYAHTMGHIRIPEDLKRNTPILDSTERVLLPGQVRKINWIA